MKHLVRLCALALSCVALLVGFSNAFAHWRDGSGPFDLSDLGRTLGAEARRGQALEVRDRAILRCSAGKARVAQEVIAGRLSLRAAAAHFAALHAEAAEADSEVGGSTRLPRGEQALCRNVIQWVRAALEDDHVRDPSQSPVVVRLEAQFRRSFPAQARGVLL